MKNKNKKNNENEINTNSNQNSNLNNNLQTPNKNNNFEILTNSEDKLLKDFSEEKKKKQNLIKEITLPSETKKFYKKISEYDSKILLYYDVSFINFYYNFSESQIK